MDDDGDGDRAGIGVVGDPGRTVTGVICGSAGGIMGAADTGEFLGTLSETTLPPAATGSFDVGCGGKNVFSNRGNARGVVMVACTDRDLDGLEGSSFT